MVKKRLYRWLKERNNSAMNPYDLIAKHFADTLQGVAEQVDTLAPALEAAGALLAQALLQDGKIILCGLGPDAAAAQLLGTYLINRFELDRPALPAINLAQGSSTTTGVIGASGSNDLFARQIKALGRPEDVLVCIGSHQSHTALLRAIQTAHDSDMTVVILCNQELNDLSSLISGNDVSIAIQGSRPSLVLELQIMCIHRLVELVEQSLFFNNMEEHP